MTDWHRIHVIEDEVSRELSRALEKHASLTCAHHGYAILLEEVDELWDEVKKRERSKERMRDEAIQVAAMAIRFIHDVCKE